MNGDTRLRIRGLTEDDACDVIVLVSRVAGLDTVVLTKLEFNPSEAEEREFLRRYADPECGLAFGAWRDGALCGVVFLDRLKPQRRYHTLVVGISVEPDAWGQGVGAALLTHALAAARRTAGVGRVELTVAANNARGRALFAATGFVEEGRKRASILLPSGPVDEIVMAQLIERDHAG